MGLDKKFEDLMNEMANAAKAAKKKSQEDKQEKQMAASDEEMDEFALEVAEMKEEFKEFESNPLTESQNTIMQEILKAITFGSKRIVVQGSAGTGKTFLVQYLIKEYRRTKSWGRVQITAPTNRAVAVLMEKQVSPPYYMEFMTIHKALFLKRKINDKTGEVTFVPDYNPKKDRPFKGTSLLIIDEASMLNSMLLYFLENPEYKDTIMIFLGEPLPSINLFNCWNILKVYKLQSSLKRQA